MLANVITCSRIIIARKLGYDTIAIWGNPENYACYGFKNCKRYNVCLEEDVYPVALMVKVLEDDALADKCWKYVESPAHQIDESGFEEFDSTFTQMEKGYKYTQELFYIYSRSNVLRQQHTDSTVYPKAYYTQGLLFLEDAPYSTVHFWGHIIWYFLYKKIVNHTVIGCTVNELIGSILLIIFFICAISK